METYDVTFLREVLLWWFGCDEVCGFLPASAPEEIRVNNDKVMVSIDPDQKTLGILQLGDRVTLDLAQSWPLRELCDPRDWDDEFLSFLRELEVETQNRKPVFVVTAFTEPLRIHYRKRPAVVSFLKRFVVLSLDTGANDPVKMIVASNKLQYPLKCNAPSGYALLFVPESLNLHTTS